MAEILIIDDNKNMCTMLTRALIGKGHNTHTAHTMVDGRALAAKGGYDIVFIDVHLPDGSGLDLLPLFKTGADDPECIIITAFDEIESAITAMKHVVWDYLQKPFSIHDLRLTLDRALLYHKEKNRGPRKTVNRIKIIGTSPAMVRCLDQMSMAAEGDVNVLITGATGTGKELIAQAIHDNSGRKKKSMVTLDCTVLPDNLMESVLFGYVKGAYTGAETSQEGLIWQAEGGTLFLDEVGELPLLLQKKFLRVLQEHVYRPVGGREERKSDFRLVSATNRNLEDMVKNGSCREDLLYRLKTFSIEMPLLSERQMDIEALVHYHIFELCRRYDLKPKLISDELLKDMKRYSWPGNVRELVNTIDRMLTMARNETTLYPVHLPPEVRLKLTGGMFEKKPLPETIVKQGDNGVDISRPLKEIREDMVRTLESDYLKKLLQETGNNLNTACHRSGLARSQFYNLMKKYGIDR
jgi:two-component system NtrC family response regulator